MNYRTVSYSAFSCSTFICRIITPLTFISSLLVTGSLTGCGGGDDIIIVTPPVQHSKSLFIDFNDADTSWKAGFADYPAGQETFYELASGYSTLPAALDTTKQGFKLTGNNHSDDLFMFVTKEFDGLRPNARYDVDFELTCGSNAKSGCMGVGGAPGEGVTIKAGATRTEPLAVNNGAGTYLMNIDKGNQAVGGSDAIVLGDFANGIDCASTDDSYAKKTLKSVKGSYTTFTSADGSLWILFGTDSGYEATTSIYLISAIVTATQR
jgi:hypothetical protein